MSKKNEIELKCFMNTTEVITWLESLVESFRAGRVVLTHGKQSLVLTPPEQVEVEVEARQKKGKSRFLLELSWKESEEVQSPQDFSISSEVFEPESAGSEVPDEAEGKVAVEAPEETEPADEDAGETVEQSAEASATEAPNSSDAKVSLSEGLASRRNF